MGIQKRETIGIVETRYGLVAGNERNGITEFCSIPYAAPPVGELRWKAPQEPAAWEGVRDCTRFLGLAWQNYGMCGKKALVDFPMDEDCLFLHIWTPAAHAGENLPVIFWIHGGGYSGGTGQEENYRGWHLAEQGVVVVNINYRLGVLGFLTHPELTAESGYSGNYGLLDQIAALKWVKGNIRAFGGDPNRITIVGQSAGGGSVNCLLTSSLTKGLFQGAVIQSGGPHKVPFLSRTKEDSEAMGLEFMKEMNCSDLSELRSVSPRELTAAGEKYFFAPIIDQYVVPEEAYAAYLNGRIHDVPLIIGNNSDEGMGPGPRSGVTDFESYVEWVKKQWGHLSEEYFSLYPATEENWKRIMLESSRDKDFLSYNIIAQKAQTKRVSPIFRYYFCEPVCKTDGTFLGAEHSTEIFYLFNNLDKFGKITLSGETWEPDLPISSWKLADMMCKMWASFAKYGEPNAPGLPYWPPFCDEGLHMQLIRGNAQAQTTDFPERMAFQLRAMEAEL